MFHRQRVEGPDLSYYLKDFGKLQLAWWEVALLLVHTMLICSPWRTGRVRFDKMFLLVHAWSHTRGCFLLACNLPASGGISFPVAFQPFLFCLSWHYWSGIFLRFPPHHHQLWQSFPNQKHFLFAFGATDTISFALTSSRYFSPVQLTQTQYRFRDMGSEVGCYSWSSEQTSPLTAGTESLQLPGTRLTCIWCCFNHAAGTLNKTVSKRKDLDCFDNLQPEEPWNTV